MTKEDCPTCPERRAEPTGRLKAEPRSPAVAGGPAYLEQVTRVVCQAFGG